MSGEREWRVKHGMYKTPENSVWRAMRYRCTNPNSQRYARYGGRGVRVCERWDSFEAFIEDMGPRPGPGYSIERIDNDGDYEPSNCRWATREEQNRNKSDNVHLEHDGERLTLGEWSKRLGICPKTLEYRMKAGWPVEDVLSREVEPRSWSGSPGHPRGRKTSWMRNRPSGHVRPGRQMKIVLANLHEIRRLLDQGVSQRVVAAMHGIGQPGLSTCLKKYQASPEAYSSWIQAAREEVQGRIDRERGRR